MSQTSTIQIIVEAGPTAPASHLNNALAATTTTTTTTTPAALSPSPKGTNTESPGSQNKSRRISAALTLAAARGKKPAAESSGSTSTVTTSTKRHQHASIGKWTDAEDDLLRRTVSAHSAKNWKKVAAHLPGRTDIQCLHRWQKVLRPGLVRGPWTPAEDAAMTELVHQHGVKKWSVIARKLGGGRLGKQCRERWYNHLDPSIKRGGLTPEEDKTIIDGLARMGNKCAKIATLLPGRTDNSVKNRWHATLKKKMPEGGNNGSSSSNNNNKAKTAVQAEPPTMARTAASTAARPATPPVIEDPLRAGGSGVGPRIAPLVGNTTTNTRAAARHQRHQSSKSMWDEDFEAELLVLLGPTPTTTAEQQLQQQQQRPRTPVPNPLATATAIASKKAIEESELQQQEQQRPRTPVPNPLAATSTTGKTANVESSCQNEGQEKKKEEEKKSITKASPIAGVPTSPIRRGARRTEKASDTRSRGTFPKVLVSYHGGNGLYSPNSSGQQQQQLPSPAAQPSDRLVAAALSAYDLPHDAQPASVSMAMLGTTVSTGRHRDRNSFKFAGSAPAGGDRDSLLSTGSNELVISAPLSLRVNETVCGTHATKQPLVADAPAFVTGPPTGPIHHHRQIQITKESVFVFTILYLLLFGACTRWSVMGRNIRKLREWFGIEITSSPTHDDRIPLMRGARNDAETPHDLPFCYKEYIEHRELVVRALEKLLAKICLKYKLRGTATIAKGCLNTAGGGAAIGAGSASFIAANAVAAATTTSCATTAAAALSTAATAGTAAAALSIAAPVTLGVSLGASLGIFAGKFFVDRAHRDELTRLENCLRSMEGKDFVVIEIISIHRQRALAQANKSASTFEKIGVGCDIMRSDGVFGSFPAEIQEGISAYNAVGDGALTASDLELLNKAVGDKFVLAGKELAAGGSELAINIATGFGILSLGFGIWDVSSGIKNLRNTDFEQAFADFINILKTQNITIRQHESLFRSNKAKRGRLTYINGGGGCVRKMQVSYCVANRSSGEEMQGDITTISRDVEEIHSDARVVLLPPGACDIKVQFKVIGGSMARKVDRQEPKQPWVFPYETEIIEIPDGDGVDAVFEVRGTSLHSYVHKAWDFGKNESCAHLRERWEWCGSDERKEKLLQRAKDAFVNCVHLWA